MRDPSPTKQAVAAGENPNFTPHHERESQGYVTSCCVKTRLIDTGSLQRRPFTALHRAGKRVVFPSDFGAGLHKYACSLLNASDVDGNVEVD